MKHSNPSEAGRLLILLDDKLTSLINETTSEDRQPAKTIDTSRIEPAVKVNQGATPRQEIYPPATPAYQAESRAAASDVASTVEPAAKPEPAPEIRPARVVEKTLFSIDPPTPPAPVVPPNVEIPVAVEQPPRIDAPRKIDLSRFSLRRRSDAAAKEAAPVEPPVAVVEPVPTPVPEAELAPPLAPPEVVTPILHLPDATPLPPLDRTSGGTEAAEPAVSPPEPEPSSDNGAEPEEIEPPRQAEDPPRTMETLAERFAKLMLPGELFSASRQSKASAAGDVLGKARPPSDRLPKGAPAADQLPKSIPPAELLSPGPVDQPGPPDIASVEPDPEASATRTATPRVVPPVSDLNVRRLHNVADLSGAAAILIEASTQTTNRLELKKVDEGLDIVVQGLAQPLGTVRMAPDGANHVVFHPLFGLDLPGREPNRADLEIWIRTLSEVVVKVLDKITTRRKTTGGPTPKESSS